MSVVSKKLNIFKIEDLHAHNLSRCNNANIAKSGRVCEIQSNKAERKGGSVGETDGKIGRQQCWRDRQVGKLRGRLGDGDDWIRVHRHSITPHVLSQLCLSFSSSIQGWKDGSHYFTGVSVTLTFLFL